MDIQFLALMIPIVSIVGFFIMIIYLRKYENQERMAVIEKGLEPNLFSRKQLNTSATLRTSLLLIGAGIGCLCGYFLDRAYDMEEVAYFSMLFIFGGLGLAAAYIIESRKQRSNR